MILLQTKLFKPKQRPFLIPRSHLIEKLNAGLACKLTFISAPAGFGKTTLVTDWIATNQRPATWLSLDELDNELVRFWCYIAAALERVLPIDPFILELLNGEAIPDYQTIVIHLVNLLATNSAQLVFVLDDFHVITDTKILQGLAYFVDHAPPSFHLVITTRVDPDLPLSRWRARRELNEIRAGDLRFSLAETAVLLQTMNLTLTEQQTARLEARTEGWIAGLQLAGLSMQRQADVSSFIDNFAGDHRYIMDYLTDEVLSIQSPQIESFLLQSSILERLSPELCDAILPESFHPTSSILRHLESNNLFLVALDDGRHWYRYHHLFADLLRERLCQKLPPDQIETLHRRAAHWLAAHDFIDEALSHAVVVDEWEALTNAIARLAIPLFYQGRSKRVARWLHRLPEKVIQDDPRLNVERAWLCLINLDWQGVGAYLETAVFPNTDPAYKVKAHNIEAWHAITTGDPTRGIAIANDALVQLPNALLAERGELLTTVGQGYFAQGDFEKGVHSLTNALSYLERGHHWAGLSGATAFLMRKYLQRGRLQQARTVGERFFEGYGDQPMMQIGGGLQASAFYALTLFESGAVSEIEQTDKLATRTLELAELSMPNAEMGIWMRLFLALVKQKRGDEVTAHVLAEEAAAQLRLLPAHPALADHYDLLIRYYLLVNNNTAVSEWLDRVAALDLSSGHATMIRNRIRQAQAVLQTNPNDLSQLLAVKKQLIDIIEIALPDFTLMKAHAVLALINDAVGAVDDALRSVELTLRLAAPEQWIQMFAYPGERMTRLLMQAQSTTAVPDFCAQVLTAVQTTPVPAPSASTMTPGLLDPLTEREMEVLQLLAQGCSNREIANKLFIALGTTKRHIANIYSKMAVSNRTEAAVRARELRLLG